METARPEYEFLDLSDVKEAELSRLECALFERPAYTPAGAQHRLAWADPHHELSSCSSSTGGAATVSSSLDSLSGGECDMAPHSPQRSAPPPAAPPPPYVQPPPPPPYTHPHPHPPPPPHHHQQWPVVPPNVYVSQVTANVNVHGYMGQYYQPPQSQYGPPPQPGDRQPRGTHRRERRGKRGPSPPPPQPPPYYVPYPQYYPAAQAQGAPLYHLPLYQPVTYMGHYPYASYYPEYSMPVEEGEKGPDEQYPQEMLMEQEAVDAYFAGAHYAPGPPYGPQPDGAVEYAPPVYLPPPPPHQPLHAPHPPPHYQPTPHQFNVHAKNFVQNQNQAKSFTPPEVKPQEQKPPAAVPIASVSVAAVDALPVTELKISSKEPASPKIVPTAPTESLQAKASPTANNDKGFPKIQAQPEPPKPAQIVPDTKHEIPSQIVKNFPSTGPPTALPTVATKVPPNTAKITKGPAAPFTGGKALPKTAPIPQTAIPTQQPIPTPKAPFANRQRRDGPATRSPDNGAETIDRSAPVVEHPKREPPLPPSKAPMPISISLSSQGGAPLIVSNKSPFAHSRKAALVATPEPPPTPQPPPPAPTASDFPPPPTPRNRGEPTPTPTQVQQQPAPASGKSWASLFAGNKSLGMSVSSVSLPAATLIQEEPPIIPLVAAPTPAPNVQKPVAKVPPYDASPLPQAVVLEKHIPPPRPLVSVPLATPVISYSEKTSASVVAAVPKPASPAQPPPAAPAAPPTPTAPAPAPPVAASEIREVPIVKETAPATPVQPSPFADDPNSYRMGEFLSKYSLDNRTVSLLPRGLTNRSNFCYVNAILQALIACAPFYNMLKALPYQTRRGKSSTPVIDAMVELCYEFTPLASVGRGSRARGVEGAAGAALPVQTGAPLDPAAAHKVLRALRPFAGAHEGRQEDAEEFLGCLLNGLNDEMLELMKLVEPDEPKEAPTNGMIVPEPAVEEDDDDDEWKVMGPKNKGSVERSWGAGRTPLSDIFRGRTRCRLHRAPGAAHHVTDAVQPFFTLQLDIERASSVKEALELLAGRDQLEGVTAAAGGRVVVDAWQQLSLETLPVVLLLHLKCFQLDGDGHTAKIVKSVDFPIDLKIDPKIMSAKVKYNTRQRMYKLYAVVYHEGVEAVKGHYLTDALHGQAGWMRYDDSTVTLVSEAQVLKPKAPRMPYLLMYRRQDTLPAPPAHPAHPAPHRPPSKQD